MVEIEINEDLIGKRVIWEDKHGRILEGEVTEISPSGKYIKIDDEWKKIDKIEALEIL